MTTAQLRDRSVTAHGLSLRYLEKGSGRPTLLLHSLNPRSCAEEWLRTMDVYVGAGCHIFALDMPGWGLSQQPPDGRYHFPLWIEAVRALVTALGLERVDVVGRTMGGWIGALFAHQYPDRVRRLVLFNNAGLNPRPPLSYDNLAAMPSLESVRAWYRDDTVAQVVYERLHQPGRTEQFRTLLDYVLDPQVRNEWSLRERLPETRVPILFAMRDSGGEMATQYAIEGFGLAPRARLFVTKGTGPEDTAESELAAAASSFLSSATDGS